MEATIRRIERRIKELGMKDKDFCTNTGISQSTFATWKQRGTDPKAKYMSVIADTLETTEDYLLGWTDDYYDYETDPDYRLSECQGSAWEHILKECNYDLEQAYHKWVEYDEAVREEAQRDSAMHRHEYALTDGLMYVKEPPCEYQASPTPGPIQRKGMILEPIRYKKQVPIVGRISAGQPLTAIENIDGYENVTDETIDYALIVRGDSMIGARIFEGDIVYVTKDTDYENGDIVIALVNGEDATIKRFYKYGREIILRPENPTLKEMHFPANEVQLLGKVKEVKFKI